MIEIDLVKDGCKQYRTWSEWLKSDEPAAYMETGENKMNATARNRLRHARKKNYTARIVSWAERNALLEDIFEINLSAEVRQGKPMLDAYKNYPDAFTPKEYWSGCCQHDSIFYGVFSAENKLVGYMAGSYCGEMVGVTYILGHVKYLKDGIMLLLWHQFVMQNLGFYRKHIVYSRWKDGTDGLRYWKHSVGMRPESLTEKKTTL